MGFLRLLLFNRLNQRFSIRAAHEKCEWPSKKAAHETKDGSSFEGSNNTLGSKKSHNEACSAPVKETNKGSTAASTPITLTGDLNKDDYHICLCGVYGESQILMTEHTTFYNKETDGLIYACLQRIWPLKRLGKTFTLTGKTNKEFGLAWLGDKRKDSGSTYSVSEDLDTYREDIRWGLGGAALNFRQNYDDKNYNRTIYIDETCGDGTSVAAGEGVVLGFWSPYYVNWIGSTSIPLLDRGRYRSIGQNLAREICETPPNKMKPVDFGKAAVKHLTQYKVKVEVHNRDWIVKKGMEAFLTVADSSCTEPMFVECVYKGAGSGKPTVLLSTSGITYDSGGLCLSPLDQVTDQRVSIAGAAVALGVLYALARLTIKVNVACVIPLCENMISGQCLKVGDVLKVGKNYVQIDRLGLEGHVLLADALEYGQQEYKPRLVLNVATLTNEVKQVTGSGAFGCFTNNEHAWQCMKKVGAISGDRPWRLPVWDYYQRQLSNYGSRISSRIGETDQATSCVSAAFLKKFMHCDWVHCDITGVSKVGNMEQPIPYLDVRYATGRPTRTLMQFLEAVGNGCLDK